MLLLVPVLVRSTMHEYRYVLRCGLFVKNFDTGRVLHETRRVEPVEWSGGDVLGFLANGISAVTFIIVDEEQFDGVGRRWGTNHLFTRENFTGGAAFVERVTSIIDDQRRYREQ